MSLAPADRSPGATVPPCPRCGGGTARVHRRARDHWLASFRREPVLRFECRSAACGWGGLLAPHATPGGAGRRPRVAGALLAFVVAAAALGLVAVTADRWVAGSDAGPAAAQAAASLRPKIQDAATQVPPAGWHTVGEALPSDDARHAGHAAGLQLRHGCIWGAPGRDPYRGTAEQALQAAGLPADAVRAIAQRIRRGESDGEITLARDGIQSADGQRQFGRRLVASTYGMTLCFDTLVNFVEGHVERAPLFEFTSAEGRRFSVIVPDVCGNVGVISEQPPAGIVLGERAERAAHPVAPGTMEMPTSAGAPPQAASHGTGGAAAAPLAGGGAGAGAGGRPAPPAPSMVSGGSVPSPRGTEPPSPTQSPTQPPTQPPTSPVGPTPPATPEPPLTPPTGEPGPSTPPPASGGAPPTPPTPQVTPPQPPIGTTPPAPTKPSLTPPAVDPGPGTPPTGTGVTAPPPQVTPPQPPQPPVGPTPPAKPEPPAKPPTVHPGSSTPPPGSGGNPPTPQVTPPLPPPSIAPGPGTPPPVDTPPPTPPLPPGGPTPPTPTEPPPTPPTPPEAPELPPPSEPPPWLPPEPPWLPPVEPPWGGAPPPPSVDPEPPRSVPAPGTLSTGLLGLAALMLSRRWGRRRQR